MKRHLVMSIHRLRYGCGLGIPRLIISVGSRRCAEPTLRSAATLSFNKTKISKTSLETVIGCGIWIRAFNILKSSWSSGSATILKGRWRRAHHMASKYRKRWLEYVEPIANDVICWVAWFSLSGSHLSTCFERFPVESSKRWRWT